MRGWRGRLVSSARDSALSPGVWLICALALLSTVGVAVLGSQRRDGLTFWIFALPHRALYEQPVADWNASRGVRIHMELLNMPSLERRMLSGFLGDVPTADLIEVERNIAGRAFRGPLESVGFVDLTDRLEREGIRATLNPPSFSPWTSRGRVFGLPHDVHPIMLGYRADIAEAAGVDVESIETWDDFEREFAKVKVDRDGDGSPDRYPLALWYTDQHRIEALVLQGGGGLFDASGRPTLASPANARVLARVARWCVGPGRIAADVPDFDPVGNTLKARGDAVAYIMPDWMCNVWKAELPGLAGSMKLMPLPAWEPGGRRTSVWGGTMLGIARTCPDVETAWAFARALYLSDEHAVELYRKGDIITPVMAHWDHPAFAEPDPYFSGQRKGLAYIELAPDVPVRSSSPFNNIASLAVRDAATRLGEWAGRTGTTDDALVEEKALELLAEAQRVVQRHIDRSLFLREGDA